MTNSKLIKKKQKKENQFKLSLMVVHPMTSELWKMIMDKIKDCVCIRKNLDFDGNLVSI